MPIGEISEGYPPPAKKARQSPESKKRAQGLTTPVSRKVFTPNLILSKKYKIF